MLHENGEDAKLLAGGHSLLPLMKLRLAAPTLLVDLRKIPGLHGIQRENGGWRIGAMTHARRAPGHARARACVARAASLIADQQVRNRGTIGGSLAHGDPASDLPAVLLALEGEVTARGPNGERTIAAADLFQDYLTTSLAHDEVITEVRLPDAERLRLRLPEVHPPRRGLGDGRRVRAREGPRTARARTCASGSPTWARRRCAPRPPRRRCAASALDDDVDRRRRRAGGRGHRAAGRPQRDARLQAPPGAGAHAEGARGGSERLSLDVAAAVQEALARERYLADRGLATAVFLAATLEQPLLLEGEAGVGKTEVAKALAGATGARLIRLQCHEGIDLHHALYDWDYPRQLLHLRARRRRRSRSTPSASCCAARCSRRSRPSEPVVLLIDEIDRADDEFEAFLLEFLSDFQVTIPELGTITRRAAGRSSCSPRTARASCTTRSSAAASTTGSTTPTPSARPRSCARACPACRTRSPERVCAAVARLRGEELYKLPGVGETIDWAQALLALDEARPRRHARRRPEGARGHRPRARARRCCGVPEARSRSRGRRRPARAARGVDARGRRARRRGRAARRPPGARGRRSRRPRRRLLRAAGHAVLAP